MKRLIVNADDFGFTRGVNAGIVRAYRTGIVTSTTIMANGDAFEDAIELARANPGLGVGCHLVAVGGRPVAQSSEISPLLDGDGALPPTLMQLVIRIARRPIVAEVLVREFRSQLQRVIGAGIEPTHVDTHKHSHTHPQVMKALCRVIGEFGIKRVRNPFERIVTNSRLSNFSNFAYLKQSGLSAAIQPGALMFKRFVREHDLKTPERFFGVKMTGMLDSAAIQRIMENLGGGTSELMCHPGVCDDELERGRTRLKHERELELEALCDTSLRRVAEEQGIELINYRELL